jgi:hypothetical protein
MKKDFSESKRTTNKKVAKLKSLAEDIVLIKKMKENKKEDRLDLSEAKSFYRQLLTSKF